MRRLFRRPDSKRAKGGSMKEDMVQNAGGRKDASREHKNLRHTEDGTQSAPASPRYRKDEERLVVPSLRVPFVASEPILTERLPSPRFPQSPRRWKISGRVSEEARSEALRTLEHRISEALVRDDGKKIQEVLEDRRVERSVIVKTLLKVVALRMSDESLNRNIRREASFYFSLYATETDPDEVALLAVKYMEPQEAAGYISYCTHSGWPSLMREALRREDSIIIRYVWDIPERPHRYALRKVLLSYLQETDTTPISKVYSSVSEDSETSLPEDSEESLSDNPQDNTPSVQAPDRISLAIFKFLMKLVMESEGYLLVVLQEDCLARGLTTIYDILDHV